MVEGERRQLAVLFCDVVESTPLSQRVDIETFGQLLLDFQQMATATIKSFGGTVGHYAGDGVASWFGWPVAHEDDTALAVHAGLEILAKLEDLNATVEVTHGVRLEARGAVHVGPVVVRTERPDAPAFGETIHVAARLESFAQPGTLVMSETAHRVAGARFATAYVGAPELKGLAAPVRVHRVDGVRADDEAPATGFRAPLVSREREVAYLREAWSATQRGIGRTVVISGEPGVGKSRLLATLRAEVAGGPHRWLDVRCSPLGVNTAFRPVADMVRRGLGIRGTDTPEDQRRSISAALLEGRPEVEPLIGALLGLEAEHLPAPEKFRRDLMDAVHSWVLLLTHESPVVVAVEDLHWSDPSTLELVRMLSDRTAAAPVLIVLTQRLESALAFGPAAELRLERLGDEEARTLARHLAAAQGLGPDVADRVAERSDGVPLFVEELVASVGDSDDDAGLPTSLQSSLLARLDRLGPARNVAQIAAVLGRSFPEQLLAAVAQVPPGQLADALAQLTKAGLVESHTTVDGLRYDFRHALIRDAAYESLLRARRTQLHSRVAAIVEERFPERVARDPELLGHHLALGGEPLRAAGCFERAGRRAARTAALAEAAAHYRHGIDLLREVAPSRERDRQEMWLGILLGNALMGLEGHGADSLRPVWRRAIELGEQVGDADELTAALNGLAVQDVDNGDLAAAEVLSRRQIELADETGSRFARLRGHGTMGMILFYRGRGVQALEHYQASLACYEPGDFNLVTFGVGHDQGIFARAMSSWALWWVGRPADALREVREAVGEAEQLGSFLSLAMARHFMAVAYSLRRDSRAALEQAQANAAFSHELGFPFWEGAALLAAGTERTRMGDPGGIADVQNGLGLLAGAGSRAATPSGMATLSEAHFAAGDAQAALATVEAGLGASRELEQPYWDAELMRLQARYLLALDPGDAPRADALLRAALEDATKRGAAGPALRAATDYGARLAEHGRAPEARSVLADALAAVQGGDDTPDMRDAQAVLHDLPTTALDAKELR